jgi:hypothetical protein
MLAGEEYKADFSKTLPLKAGERFSLENVNGGVTIATWKEDKVEIKAVKTARRYQEDLDKVEIRVDEGAGSVSVKAVWPKFPRRANVSLEFTVMVPEGVDLDKVGTVNGGVVITGRYGRLFVGTTNGSVSINDASGALEAGTTNGEVRVSRFEGRIEGGRPTATSGEGVGFKDGSRRRRRTAPSRWPSPLPSRSMPTSGPACRTATSRSISRSRSRTSASRSAGSKGGSARAAPRSRCIRPTARSS